MLIAAQKGKIRRELGLWEDELTSIIFGPLTLLNLQGAVWTFFETLLKTISPNHPYINDLAALSSKKNNAKILFWPIIKEELSTTSIRQYVEPDLIIRASGDTDTPLNILVEFKWGAELQPPCELINQWAHKGRYEEKWLHFYVTESIHKSISGTKNSIKLVNGFIKGTATCCEAHRAINRKELQNLISDIPTWENALIPCSWCHIRETVTSLATPQNEAISIWADSVDSFLGKLGVASFTGFSFLKGMESNFPQNQMPLPYSNLPWFDFNHIELQKNYTLPFSFA